MSLVSTVLGDFAQGVGAGSITFLIALPGAVATRLAYKLPKSLRQAIQIYCLYVLVYALLYIFTGPPPVSVLAVLVVPNLIYLVCAAAFSGKAAKLWQGSGLMAAFFGAGIAII